MGYIGSDPKTKESVSTSQLINDSVTNEKIVDDILFTSVTSSIVSASHITASSYQGGFDTGTSTRISGSLGVNATTIRNLTSAGITGSFSPSSASFSTRTTTLEVASGSLSTRVTTNESDLTTLKGSGTTQGVGTSDSPTFAGVTVTGTLTAQEVHTEFESASIIFSSGSTKFGDTIDDTHQVTGSLLMTGSMAVGTGRGITPNGIFDVGLNTNGTRRFSVSFEDSLVSLSAKNQSNNGEVLKLMGDGLRIHTGTNTSGTEKMRIDSSGNVGIGTNNPQSEVHISGSGEVQLYIDAQGGNNSGIRLLEAGANKWTIGNDQSNDSLFFYTFEGSAKRFVLDNNSRISLSNNDSGTSNTIFGKSAGASLDAGSNYNVFIGEGVSDASMNDSTHNTGVGYTALSALTTGGANTAVGALAGEDLNTGTNNTLIGKEAGKNLTDGNENVIIGDGAGQTTTGVHDAVIIGRGAAQNGNITTAANGTVAIGYKALEGLTTGASNTAIGNSAGKGLVGGSNNTIVGALAGDAMTDNVSNVVIGKSAFSAADSGENYNVVIGGDAGSAINNGSSVQNVIIGQDAGTGGTGIFRYNVAIGINALKSTGNNQVQEVVAVGREAATKINSNDASGTVAIGSFALGELTSGRYNTAIGWAALYESMDVGDGNTAVGYRCMYSFNPSADGHGSNTAVGYKAGYSNLTSENNTFMGARAGEDVTGASNTIIGREAALDGTSINHCVIIGANAGSNASMTGDSNVFIGSSAGDANTNGTNNIVIGGGSDGGATQDYQITIGSQFNNDGDDNSIQFVNGALSRRLSYDLDSGNATITSDERTKEDITDYQIGLEFINKLKPKQFTKKKNADLPAEFFGEYTAHRNDTTKNPRVYQGMIAQEVSASMVEMGITPTHITGSSVSNPHFSGWEQSKESGEQRLSYVSFVTPLIQSVKELTDEIRFLRGAITGSTDLNQLKALVSGSQFV